MKREIRCRLFVPTEDGFCEYDDLSSVRKCEFADECVRRMGEVLNEKPMQGLFRAASSVLERV